MTLLETTYTNLHSIGLVACAEAFSADYLGKNRNWFAYQKHVGRDYSVSAAIQCLRAIKGSLKREDLDAQNRTLLMRTAEQLQLHLATKHSIAEVC